MQVIQIGAGQTEGFLIFGQGNPGVVAQLFAALGAGGFAGGDEDGQFGGFGH
jgi:hypothetical protein